MKYFYLTVFIFSIAISSFSQSALNSNGNLPLPDDASLLITLPGNMVESITGNQNTIAPQKNSILFNPNPASSFVRISYTIASCCKVGLSIYNQIGQETITVVKEYQKEGNYFFDADISKLLPGIYFVRLHVGKEIITKKLVVN